MSTTHLRMAHLVVGSGRGAAVDGWREHGFRHPVPSHVCLALHFDYIPAPRSLNPPYGLPRTGIYCKVMRSTTRSRAWHPIRHSRPLCVRSPGKRTSSWTPPRDFGPTIDADAMSYAPPTAATRQPEARFTFTANNPRTGPRTAQSRDLRSRGSRSICQNTSGVEVTMAHPKSGGQQSDRQVRCATALEEALRRPGVREMMQVYRHWQQADQGLDAYRAATTEMPDTTTADRAVPASRYKR